jgi:hypothetical protein
MEVTRRRSVEHTRKINLLMVGSIVAFAKKPLGSWLSEAVPYAIEGNNGQTVHFRDPATGGGTFDAAWAIAHADFTLQHAAGEPTDA